MSESRPKRVKTSTNGAPRQPRRVRNESDGVPSSGTRHNPIFGLDPFYAPAFQVQQLAKFISCKPTYTRYADMAWMVELEFRFLYELEVQGALIFLELKDSIYPSLVRKFYTNFQHNV
ncbi:hypothetical protein Lal_00042500 [Lupinus albus]|nr:hypothetical protein Lal_00042500 [Lupinus albus]